MKDLVKKYGRWALITGASSGIGEEFAKQLAKYGFNLVLIARRKERLEVLSKYLWEKYNTKTIIAKIDLTAESFIDELKKITQDLEIGVVINNAGFGSIGEFAKCDVHWETNMIKVNCIAPTILTHYYLPKMIERKKGAIIFLGSLVAFQPTPYMTTYSATKAFNLFLAESLWYELKRYNIDVLALNPGGTKTEFLETLSMTKRKSYISAIQREPSEVVTTALKSLGKKISVVDGVINKILSQMIRFLPRRFIVASAGKITKRLYIKN